MKKRIVAACCLLAGLFLVSQGPTAAVADKGFRTITDLRGNRVALPQAKDLHRVVIISPPLVSIFASLHITGVKIVGAHKFAFENANKKLLDLLLPEWRNISTGFISGFTSNAEELLKLKPDVILVYGKFQQEGLQGIPVPVLDFFIKKHDDEVWSVSVENLMREIFAVDPAAPSLQAEWDLAKETAATLLAKRKGPRKKGLMIMSNTGDKIMVRGNNPSGDDWLTPSGIANAAGLKGLNREVSMEQFYAWNPDVIFSFMGMPASRYIKGDIPGQDWRHIKAVQDRAVYDTPKGLMTWAAPCTDSPLALLWMVSKNYPELLSESDFIDMMKAFYSRRCGLALSRDLIDSILYPHERG